MQREKQAQRLALAEKHLLDKEKSYERINKDEFQKAEKGGICSK